LSRHGGDCDPSGQHGLSITITGSEATAADAGAAGVLSLCIPDPSKIQDGVPISLGAAVFEAPAWDLSGTLRSTSDAGAAASCSFFWPSGTDTTTGDNATVTFTDLCQGNTTHFLMTFAGSVTTNCAGDPTSRALTLGGTADVTPQ
jgi:hypothetical protein